MKTFLFELCVESLKAALAAERGDADRIELCARLDLSGITPSQSLTTAAVQALSIPVHVLIRPRGGNFVYSAEEFDQMRQQVQWVKEAGAAGVAMGVLLPDSRVDVDRSRELVELARPMKVTFHRAFDETPDLGVALEAVIKTRADCLLTSGGAPNVLTGATQVGQAGWRPHSDHGRRRAEAGLHGRGSAADRCPLHARLTDPQGRGVRSGER